MSSLVKCKFSDVLGAENFTVWLKVLRFCIFVNGPFSHFYPVSYVFILLPSSKFHHFNQMKASPRKS